MKNEFLLSAILKKHAETLKDPLEYEDFVNLNATVAEEFEEEDEFIYMTCECADMAFRSGEPDEAFDEFYKLCGLPTGTVEKWTKIIEHYQQYENLQDETKWALELGLKEFPESEELLKLQDEIRK